MTVPVKFQTGFRLVRGEDLNADFAALSAAANINSGVVYYVNETRGVDANNGGADPNFPLATLDAALALESSALTKLGLSSVGRNSVVAFWGTQHRTSSLAWSLPATHLLGLGGTQRRGKRARISVSGSTGFNNLVSVTAQGCYFGNFGTFYGWVDASTALRCWADTAGRSTYDNVEFMGFGDSTASTGSSNLTGSRAFYMSTSNGESSFYNCVFGVDTLQRGAANYTIEIAGGAPRLHFENCTFEADLASAGSASSHVLIGVSGIDRYIKFKSCEFLNALSTDATAMAQAFNVSASANGAVILDQCMFNGITAIQTTPTTNMRMNMVASTTLGGLSHTVF